MNQITATLGGALTESRVVAKVTGSVVVWRKGTPWPPTKFHGNYLAAKNEAICLAAQIPGARFHTIKWCEKFSVENAPRIVERCDPIARRDGNLIAVSVPSRITDAEADTLIAQLQAARAYPAREVV